MQELATLNISSAIIRIPRYLGFTFNSVKVENDFNLVYQVTNYYFSTNIFHGGQQNEANMVMSYKFNIVSGKKIPNSLL